jgi:hypothetical protein
MCNEVNRESEELLNYLMSHFSMTREEALAEMREHNQDTEGLE